MDGDIVEDAITYAKLALGVERLKEKQEEAIKTFVKGRDCFVILPTGYGKTLCYVLLPYVFDRLRKKERTCIVLCVSPLVSLMMDQVSKYSALGLLTQYVGNHQEEVSSSDRRRIADGEYQLVFVTPEALFRSRQWHDALLSSKYQEDLVALVVDEAHCVKTWGDMFRKDFRHIGMIRSLLPSHVRIMALTATATADTRQQVISRLCMDDPAIIYEPPLKSNIYYEVKEKPQISAIVQKIACELLQYKNKAERVLVYCRKLLDVASFYEHFEKALGTSFTYPTGKPNLAKYRLVDMYTRCTDAYVKQHIVSSFADPDSTLRVVVATTAFGMGIDCPNVRHIIHWGPAEDIESQVQQTGRAGRDGHQSWSVVYYSPSDNHHTSKAMIDYCSNTTLCRRKVLFSEFCDASLLNITADGCKCCDVCKRVCKCGSCA